MNLVVDANIIFACLIKDSTTAELLFEPSIYLFAPEFLFEEISKYEGEISKKTKRPKQDLHEILELLMDRTALVPKEDFQSCLEKAEKTFSDPNDVPYFALAIAMNIPIWSNDKKLKKQNKIKIYSTADLLYG